MSNEWSNLSDKELAIGYWWTKYRVQIKAGFIMFLVVLIGFFTLNSTRKFYDYFVQSRNYELMLKELTKNRINYAYLHRINAPKKLQIKFTKAIPGQNSDFYDIISEVENINQDRWLERLRYQFSVDGKLTDEREIYILPNEKKYLYYFNYKNNRAPGSLRLLIKKETWTKIKDSSLLDNKKYFKKADVKISNIKFIPGVNGADSEVNFDLTNNYISGLWEIDAQILLKQSNSIRGFNTIKINKLKSGESRNIKVNMGNVQVLGIHPEILISANIIDKNNVMFTDFDIPNSRIR